MRRSVLHWRGDGANWKLISDFVCWRQCHPMSSNAIKPGEDLLTLNNFDYAEWLYPCLRRLLLLLLHGYHHFHNDNIIVLIIYHNNTPNGDIDNHQQLFGMFIPRLLDETCRIPSIQGSNGSSLAEVNHGSSQGGGRRCFRNEIRINMGAITHTYIYIYIFMSYIQ